MTTRLAKKSAPNHGFCQRSFGGVKNAADIVPAKRADQPLFAIDNSCRPTFRETGNSLWLPTVT